MVEFTSNHIVQKHLNCSGRGKSFACFMRLELWWKQKPKESKKKAQSTIIRCRWEIYVVFSVGEMEMDDRIEIQYVHYRNVADKTSYRSHYSLLSVSCFMGLSKLGIALASISAIRPCSMSISTDPHRSSQIKQTE